MSRMESISTSDGVHNSHLHLEEWDSRNQRKTQTHALLVNVPLQQNLSDDACFYNSQNPRTRDLLQAQSHPASSGI